MDTGILTLLAKHGILALMLGWTNIMLAWGAKKFLELFKSHTEMVKENTRVIAQNTEALKDVKKYIRRTEDSQHDI